MRNKKKSNQMYRLERTRRKYTATPLVRISGSKGKEKEEQVLFTPLRKKEGEEMLRDVAGLLNLKEKAETVGLVIPNHLKINLNQMVKFKPNELGYQRMIGLDYKWGIMGNHDYIRLTMENIKTNCDENGLITLTLWEFMEYFGSVISMGNKDYFESNNIFIEYFNNK